MTKTELNPMALGISVGIVSSICILVMGLLAHTFFTGKPLVAGVGAMYMSYNPSVMGAILTSLVGFVNAFIGGYVIAWVYNYLLHKF